MSLSAMAAAMEAENAALHAEVAILKLQLAERGERSPDVALMVRHHLTRGETALLMRLLASNGRAVDRYTLEAAIPARDHAKDRNTKIVDVLLSNIRKKIGPDVIETIHGCGWRINPAWNAPA